MHSTYALMRVGYRIGDWDRVEACLEEHLANFELETGVRCINVQMGPSQGAVVLAHRGQTERALGMTRMPFPFEGIVGPIEGAQASALDIEKSAQIFVAAADGHGHVAQLLDQLGLLLAARGGASASGNPAVQIFHALIPGAQVLG